MDWRAAIERQREALVGILTTLVAMAASRAAGDRILPRHLHRAVLRLLRPAEASARRLIIALARTLPAPEVKPLPPRRPEPKSAIVTQGGTGVLMPRVLPAARAPLEKLSLPLLDPMRPLRIQRRVVSLGVPRISVPGYGQPFAVAPCHPPSPDDAINAVRLDMRLQALASALDDLPAAARRFVRWQARAGGAQDGSHNAAAPRHGRYRRFGRVSPLKPGRPPGWRRRPVHAVHEVLNEAHWLALTALERPDTS